MPHAADKSAPHRLHPSILREYDIRGIVGETLFDQDAYYIGRAFGSLIVEKSGAGAKICAGYDGRISSPALQEAMGSGITDAGANVIHIGMGPTPMLYYATTTLQAAGGIMVTGSHNPPNHNGFKMMLGKGAFYGKDIAALGERILAGNFTSGKGTLTIHPVKEAYTQELLNAYTATRGLKVAWDAGNGAAGDVMAAIAAKLPGTHTVLNAKIDGTFPAHHPDPTVPTNLKQLIDTVRHKGCDIGVAFDGDGDRIGVVDETGEILWGDQIMALYAADVLKSHRGATIIADVKASQVLFDEIARHGGKPLMWKTGHSLVKVKMAETKAPLAGEMSGHMFFADKYYGFDDGLYAAVRLLDILAHSVQPLSALRKALPAMVNTPELRFPCDDERKFTVVTDVAKQLKQAAADFSDVDGVRVNTPDGWWLLRASNTQAMLVARCEARDEAGLARLKKTLADTLSACGISVSV